MLRNPSSTLGQFFFNQTCERRLNTNSIFGYSAGVGLFYLFNGVKNAVVGEVFNTS